MTNPDWGIRPNRVERSPNERTVYQMLEDANKRNRELQARVTELEAVATSVRDDLRLRAEPDSDGIPVVALGSSKWQALCEVLTPNKSEKTP